MEKKIISTHIENDVVNNAPTLVFTDENGEEWVHEEQTRYAGYITALVKKENSWFFNPTTENKKNNPSAIHQRNPR